MIPQIVWLVYISKQLYEQILFVLHYKYKMGEKGARDISRDQNIIKKWFSTMDPQDDFK